jgi:hypothetical protein
MMDMQYYQHLLIIGAVAILVWCLFTYFYPRLLLIAYKRAALSKGFGDGPIPINTLHTQPKEFFTDPLAAQNASNSNVLTIGVNHDTLLSAGWLDLRKGPFVLHVPDMRDRYYSVQFTDPSKNTVFAYVGKRTTGTQAGDYLITGPRWKGQVPTDMRQISSPNNSVILVGRVFVENDNDVAEAYDLSKQIQLTPLGQLQPQQ